MVENTTARTGNRPQPPGGKAVQGTRGPNKGPKTEQESAPRPKAEAQGKTAEKPKLDIVPKNPQIISEISVKEQREMFQMLAEGKTPEKKFGLILPKDGLNAQLRKTILRDEFLDAEGKLKKTAIVRNVQESYDTLKRAILRREKQNFSEVIIMRAKPGGTWWKIFENSAVIYAKVLMPKLNPNRKIRVLQDKDFGIASKVGWVSIKNIIETGNELVNGLKMTLYEQAANYCIFKIGKVVPQETILNAIRDDEIMREHVNKLILPAETPSELNAELNRYSADVRTTVNKMSDIAKDYIGMNMLINLREAREELFIMSRGLMPPKEAYEKILKHFDILQADVAVAAESKLIELDKLESLGYGMQRLRKKLQAAMKRSAVKEVERQLEGHV